MRKQMLWVLLFCCLPLPALGGMEPVNDEELACIAAAAGPAADFYFTQVLGEKNLTLEQMDARWDSMTAEEKAAAQRAVLSKLSSMTDEEKAALRQQQMERFSSMTPEEREKVHQQMMRDFSSMTEEERAEDRAFMDQFRAAMGDLGGPPAGPPVGDAKAVSINTGAPLPRDGMRPEPGTMMGRGLP